MNTFLPHSADQFLRKHPAVMFGIVFLLAISAVLVLLLSGPAIVAYEAF